MRRIVLLSVLSLLSLTAMASNFAFREGDIVFRSGKNYPVMYISGSTITHCGIIVNTSSGLQVLEAVGPVKLTPINKFFGKNLDKAENWTKPSWQADKVAAYNPSPATVQNPPSTLAEHTASLTSSSTTSSIPAFSKSRS